MIKNCPMRHENGNCIPAGGFCTANKNICEALLNAYRMGRAQLSQEGTTKDATSDTIQPEPKKGEWIEISSINHTYKCSKCGRLLVNVADGKNNVSKHYPYCHCGADMRGEQNG